MRTCTCPKVKEIALRALAGEAQVPCPVHSPASRAEVEPIALNDDDGLGRRLAGALGVPVTINEKEL